MGKVVHRIQKISTVIANVLIVLYLLFLYTKSIGHILWCVVVQTKDSCPKLCSALFFDIYQDDVQIDLDASHLHFYVRQMLKSIFVSSVLMRTVLKKTSFLPIDTPISNGKEPVIVECVQIHFKHDICQTSSAYHKKRRRMSKRLETLKEKTEKELKKINRKRKTLYEKYWCKDEQLTKNIRCYEMLIGGLEIKKYSMEAHLIQLQYYITYSRDQLELQRERNKVIQDNIDQCGKHISNAYNPPFSEVLT